MISWRIWRALHTPFVAHPIFWLRGFNPATSYTSGLIEQLERHTRLIILSVAAIALGLVAILRGLDILLTVVIMVPLMTVVASVPIGLALAGSIYGLICATSTANTISREHYQGRFQLLGITPWGLAGATWALGTIAIQRNRILSRMRDLLYPVYLMMLVVAIFALIVYALGMGSLLDMSSYSDDSNLQDIQMILLVILILCADFIQATNIGALSGMVVAVSIRQPGATWVITIVVYLISQLVVLVISGMIWIAVWPQLGVETGPGWYLTGALTLVVMREIATLILWHSLIRALGASFDELDDIVHISFWNEWG